MQNTKILLDENDIPKKWYNILPDMGAYDSYFSGKMSDEAANEE
ncbi:MAG: hypothetical protein O8C62_06840 [Candidatus Methanoperedens sp.]|nr:hypothetical protein [Candidatus Methanoperedens sp.]